MHVNIFTKTTGVIVSDRLGISKRFLRKKRINVLIVDRTVDRYIIKSSKYKARALLENLDAHWIDWRVKRGNLVQLKQFPSPWVPLCMKERNKAYYALHVHNNCQSEHLIVQRQILNCIDFKTW